VKNIGVSNFSCLQIADLISTCRIKPSVNQIEVNPLHSRPELIDFCGKLGIHVTAYSTFGTFPTLYDPFARLFANWTWIGSAGGSMLQLEAVKEIAAKHNRSAAQVLIRWTIDLGLSVLPMSTKPERIADNFKVFDFKLDEEDMAKLAKLNTGKSCIREMIGNFFGVYPFE